MQAVARSNAQDFIALQDKDARAGFYFEGEICSPLVQAKLCFGFFLEIWPILFIRLDNFALIMQISNNSKCKDSVQLFLVFLKQDVKELKWEMTLLEPQLRIFDYEISSSLKISNIR